MEWQGGLWRLRAAIIFVAHGHYVSLVRSNDGWLKFDDDRVAEVRERAVSSSLKKNKFGYVYGVIYDR